MTKPNTTPTPVRSDIYNAEWVKEMGGHGSNDLFVQSQGQIIRPRLAYALRLGAVQPGMSILDIGCGRGEVPIKCSQAGASRAVGLDYAHVSMESARQNIQEMGLDPTQLRSLSLTCADAKLLPFNDCSFDRVFMLDIVEHLHEWELQHVWEQVWRVLKPEGLLIIHTLPNRWAIHYGYPAARWLIRGLPGQALDKRDIFHVNEQSVTSLARSLAKSRLSARVWLADQLIAQADWWQQSPVEAAEDETLVYSRLQRPLWRALYQLATRLPTRLLLTSDLFAVAWKADTPPSAILSQIPPARTERIVQKLADVLKG